MSANSWAILLRFIAYRLLNTPSVSFQKWVASPIDLERQYCVGAGSVNSHSRGATVTMISPPPPRKHQKSPCSPCSTEQVKCIIILVTPTFCSDDVYFITWYVWCSDYHLSATPASLLWLRQNCLVWAFSLISNKPILRQECIPVGCVPAARWPYAVVCSPGGGVCSEGVGVIPACTEADTPPVNRITHTCKNITLAKLRCGR